MLMTQQACHCKSYCTVVCSWRQDTLYSTSQRDILLSKILAALLWLDEEWKMLLCKGVRCKADLWEKHDVRLK